MSAALIRDGWFGSGKVRIAARLEPRAKRFARGRVITAQRAISGALVEPLASVLTARVNACEVIRECCCKMPAQTLKVRGCGSAIVTMRDRRKTGRLVGVVNHPRFGMALQPPIGGVGANARNEQSLGIDSDDLPAEVVQRQPVERLLRRCPAIGRDKRNEIHARILRQRDLLEEWSGRFTDASTPWHAKKELRWNGFAVDVYLRSVRRGLNPDGERGSGRS